MKLEKQIEQEWLYIQKRIAKSHSREDRIFDEGCKAALEWVLEKQTKSKTKEKHGKKN